MPVQFDFEGALKLAADLWGISDEVQAAASHRSTLRDAALAPTSFRGPYGVRHRELAADEDAELPKADACRDAAEDWARAWAEAADEHNQEIEQDARQLMRQYNQARYHRRWIQQINDPLGYYPYPPSGHVVPVRPATVPAGPSYAGDAAFASYSFGPYDLEARPTYQAAP